MKCKKGHLNSVRFDSLLKKKDKCNSCKIENKKEEKLSNIKRIALEINYSILEFKDAHMLIMCNNKHEPYQVTFKNFIGGSRCLTCHREKENHNKLDYTYVKNIVESMSGYSLISKDYINNKSEIIIKCDKGHVYATSFRTARKLKGCKECNNFKELSFDKLKNRIEKLGAKLLLEESDYTVGMRTYPIICKNGHNTTINNSTILRNGSCLKCKSINSRGEMNANWKGGTNSLQNSLREVIKDWRDNTFKKYNYRCDITGENGDLVVHHKIPFNHLLSQCLYELNLPLMEHINCYSNEDRDDIINKIRELHSLDTGVVLLSSVHKLFHSIFGYKNSTVEDYYEFKNNYEFYKNKGDYKYGKF